MGAIGQYRKNKKKIAYQMTRSFVIVLFVITLIMGILLVSVVSYQSYQGKLSEARILDASLKNVIDEPGNDWNQELKNLSNRQYFIQLTTPDNLTYYSEGAEILFKESDKWSFIPGIKDLVLNSSGDPYLQKPGSYKGFEFVVSLNVKEPLDVIEELVKSLFWIIIVSVITGSYIIFKLSKKISMPLVKMKNEINQFSQSSPQDTRLTVPEHPEEVRELSMAFKNLLSVLQKKIDKENQFVTDASHELRTPIAAIRGHVNLLKRRMKEHPEVLETSLEYIDKESLRLQSLVVQLLENARLNELDMMEKKKDVQEISLSELIEQLGKTYEPIIKQSFKIVVEPDVHVMANPEEIERAVTALLENAIAYTPKEGAIELHAYKDNSLQKGVIRVQDNGPGIPEPEKEKIFERFYRLDQSRSSQVSGTGIGLSIAKQLVMRNEGNLFVENAEPEGSAFVIRLPLAGTPPLK